MVYKDEKYWKASNSLIKDVDFATYELAILGECLAEIYPSNFDRWYVTWYDTSIFLNLQ